MQWVFGWCRLACRDVERPEQRPWLDVVFSFREVSACLGVRFVVETLGGNVYLRFFPVSSCPLGVGCHLDGNGWCSLDLLRRPFFTCLLVG